MKGVATRRDGGGFPERTRVQINNGLTWDMPATTTTLLPPPPPWPLPRHLEKQEDPDVVSRFLLVLLHPWSLILAYFYFLSFTSAICVVSRGCRLLVPVTVVCFLQGSAGEF